MIEPGPVETKIGDSMRLLGLGGAEVIREDPNVEAIDKELVSCWDDEVNWQTCPTQSAEDVAKVVLKAATDEKPHMRYQTSEVHNSFDNKLISSI